LKTGVSPILAVTPLYARTGAQGEAGREFRYPQALTGKLFLIDGNFQVGSTTLDM
jgi:hypothetical protein